MTADPTPDETPEPGETRDAAVPVLPDAVRARVVALAADALGRIPAEQLPPALKRVASFAPARRARLAGSQIAAVLETDDTFRERVGVHAREDVAEIATALEAGAPPAAADPVVVAATAYLLRPEGWQQVVEQAAGVVAAERSTQAGRQGADQTDRLRGQVQAAQDELRTARARYREETARLKAENATLRQRLGDERSRVAEARAEAETATAVAQESERAAEAVKAGHDAEVRRLRTRLEELEAELAAVRRTERVERGQESLRARLLLDTLLEAAQGLRRELALPTVEGSPADAVEAHVAEQGSRSSSGHGSMSVDDPVLLEQRLALPRAHLVVDGYNVTKTTWPELPLDSQRDRLVRGLAPLAARAGCEVTVVFDAADSHDRPPVNRPRGVRVLFSPVGVIADDVIRDLVAVEPPGRPLTVVTGDRAVVADVVRAGARAVDPAALTRLLSRS